MRILFPCLGSVVRLLSAIQYFWFFRQTCAKSTNESLPRAQNSLTNHHSEQAIFVTRHVSGSRNETAIRKNHCGVHRSQDSPSFSVSSTVLSGHCHPARKLVSAKAFSRSSRDFAPSITLALSYAWGCILSREHFNVYGQVRIQTTSFCNSACSRMQMNSQDR